MSDPPSSLEKRICQSWLALPLLVLVPASGRAEPIQADRPGRATPAYVMPKGAGQIQLGATYERDNGHVATWDAPEPLLRYGVVERAELRLSAAGWIGSHERGAGDGERGQRPRAIDEGPALDSSDGCRPHLCWRVSAFPPADGP